MMVFIKLLMAFFRIGLFSFGGGYAMIPLIGKEVEINGWLTHQEFADIIAIAEMTPGPIAVNSATFTGYKAAGVLGGVVATMGVVLPSFIIVLIVSHYFFQFQNHPLVQRAFYGIRPAVVGLIAAAAVSIAEVSIFKSPLSFELLKGIITVPLQYIDLKSLAVFAGSLLIMIKFKKVNPILILILAGILGIVIF